MATAIRPVTLSQAAWQAAHRAGTAAISTQLLKRGFRDTYLTGLQTTRPDLRMVGYAFTLRYAPAREDVSSVNFDNRTNVQRIAVESVGPQDVLVIDARGERGAATLGNILATRIHRRGGTGIVTDGAMRDTSLFSGIDIPTYHVGTHQTQSTARHYAADLNVPIGCAGVLVLPGDVLVGDADGVVVIPSQVAEDVLLAAAEQEAREELSLEFVQAGESILEIYPPGPALLAELERRRATTP